MAVQTQIQTRRGTAATWTSTNPTLAAGEIGFESDTGKIKIGTGSTAWNALAYTASSTAVTYLYNATAAQTTFSGADANGLTLAYTVGSEQVYLNGVLQVRGSDYTATNGTSIVLTSGALVSDVLNVIAFSALALADTYTQAQADAKFFQTANAFLAGKNKIINGDFGVWQRGTSFTTGTGYQYTVDRWQQYNYGTNTASCTQQTFTPGTAPIAGYEGQYFARFNSSSTANFFSYRIEDVRTLAGQTATFSFWAKSNSSQTITATVTQNFGSGGSATVANVISGSPALTTSWQRFSYTAAIPSISGKTIGTSSYVLLEFVGAANNAVDIWGVQLEAGSIATPFQTATGTIAGELAACQRYYYRQTIQSTPNRFGSGWNNSTTAAYILTNFPATMRTSPTALEQTGTAGDYSLVTSGTTVTVCSAVPTIDTANQFQGISIFNVASGLTAGQACLGRPVNTNAYLGWSAEL